MLAVCYGNICRSPYAAALIEREARSRGFPMTVRSAGFVGAGRPAPPPAVATALRRGVDLQAHRSCLLTREAIDASEVIVVMSADQASIVRRTFGKRRNVLILGDLDPQDINRRTIVDPWGKSDEVFADSYRRIDRCVDEMMGLLIGKRTTR